MTHGIRYGLPAVQGPRTSSGAGEFHELRLWWASQPGGKWLDDEWILQLVNVLRDIRRAFEAAR